MKVEGCGVCFRMFCGLVFMSIYLYMVCVWKFMWMYVGVCICIVCVVW